MDIHKLDFEVVLGVGGDTCPIADTVDLGLLYLKSAAIVGPLLGLDGDPEVVIEFPSMNGEVFLSNSIGDVHLLTHTLYYV